MLTVLVLIAPTNSFRKRRSVHNRPELILDSRRGHHYVRNIQVYVVVRIVCDVCKAGIVK